MRPLFFSPLFLLLFAAPAYAAQVDLERFSTQNGLQYRLDPVSRIAEVSGPAGRMRFRLDSEYALSGERLVRLRGKTSAAEGSVLVSDPAQDHLRRLLPLPARTSAAPASAPARPVEMQKIARLTPRHFIRKIVIDAGHGGQDSGAVSPRGLQEKTVVLDIARRVKEELEARGMDVTMTRDADVFIPLADRARLANDKGADFFVSIHANASPARSLKGFEIYYLSEATDDGALAVERAENSALRFNGAKPPVLHNGLKTIFWDLVESENRRESLKIADKVMGSVSGAVSTAARRIKSANFYVLKWTECPAVLVETGYLSNAQDERLLRSPVYKKEMAAAIAEGLMRYKTEYEATNGFTQ